MNDSGTRQIKLVEVGPRDGLQNESRPVPAAVKIELIDRLSASGLTAIEATAFVSPRWVPQMADCREVLAGIRRSQGVAYPVLVPNRQGFEAARAAGASEIALFAAATESFSRRNTNCSIAESMARFAAIAGLAKDSGMALRGYISCVLGCPYEGQVAARTVTHLACEFAAMGCDEISLGDTIGVGTPAQTRDLVNAVAAQVPMTQLAGHFHDTYGQGVANVVAALEQGVRVFDSSVAGLGGCPYARGASGNVATEDLLYLFRGMGLETGVDFDAVLQTGWFISDVLGRPPHSKVSLAYRAKQTPPSEAGRSPPAPSPGGPSGPL